jgi:hypothetical protein
MWQFILIKCRKPRARMQASVIPPHETALLLTADYD